MSVLLEAEGLCVGYGPVQVVRNLDLVVMSGEVVALLGPNGAGKTTTLLALSGELTPAAGQVKWKGDRLSGPLHRRVRNGLGYVTEERSVFMRLSTRDNLRVGGVSADRCLSIFPELGKRMTVAAGNLSGGEQQMLTLARALSRQPEVLLADELSLGLAPIIVDRLLAAVRSAADLGVGVLLVEQHITSAMSIADRVYVMNRGQIRFSGSAKEFQRERKSIEHSLLGGDRV
jgi:ABC-type branched-subunit amino acid transport system ATPase component